MSLLLALTGTAAQPQRAHLWKPIAIIALGFFSTEEPQAAVQQSLHAYRAHAVATSHVARGLPQRAMVEDEQDAVRTDHSQRLLFGRAPAAAVKAQPFFIWPVAKADQTLEPNPAVTNHAQALRPFRQREELVQPAPTERPVGGSGGGASLYVGASASYEPQGALAVNRASEGTEFLDLIMALTAAGVFDDG